MFHTKWNKQQYMDSINLPDKTALITENFNILPLLVLHINFLGGNRF